MRSSSFHRSAQCHSSSVRRHSLPQVSLLNHIKPVSLKSHPVLKQSMRQMIDCLQAFRIWRAAETSFASAKVFRHPAHRDQIPQLRQLLRSQPQQCSIGDFTETYSHPSDHQVGQLIREQYVQCSLEVLPHPYWKINHGYPWYLSQRGRARDEIGRQPKSGAAPAVWGAPEES